MPDLEWEHSLRRDGYQLVAGIDEAGRGPLAGNVMAAAVILPGDYAHPYLNDSKQISPKKRDLLYDELTADDRLTWCSASASVEEIETINILAASHLAMQRAIDGLSRKPDAILVDGLPVKLLTLPQKALVKGDSISLSIAAASIIAKVERDRDMLDWDRKYPEYGFSRHKGYGTKEHLTALERHGPCPIHRKTFRPIAQLTLRFDETGS